MSLAPEGRDGCVLAATTNALALFQARVKSFTRGAQKPSAEPPAELRSAAGTGTGLVSGDGTPLDARHPPSHTARRDWHLALWAGCRGVIGPEPSTSPDVERNSPRPRGSIHSTHGDAPPSRRVAWCGPCGPSAVGRGASGGAGRRPARPGAPRGAGGGSAGAGSRA